MSWPHLSVAEHDDPFCSENGFPITTAVTIVYDREDLKRQGNLFKCRTLLVIEPERRHPVLAKFPGGRCEFGGGVYDATPAATAQRECKEETGYQVLIPSNSIFYDLEKSGRTPHAVRFYLVPGDVGLAKDQGDEDGRRLVVLKHFSLEDVLYGHVQPPLLDTHRTGLVGCLEELKANLET